jgi:acyl carrier protein
MHTTESITLFVLQLFAAYVGKSAEDLDPSDNIYSFGFDSLECAEAIMELEEEFELDIPEAESEQWEQLSDAIDWVVEQLYPTE